jgi:hypothetical protein
MSAMLTYHIATRWPDREADEHVILRIIPNQPPLRFLFRGGRSEAQAEVARLNAFAQARVEEMAD